MYIMHRIAYAQCVYPTCESDNLIIAETKPFVY